MLFPLLGMLMMAGLAGCHRPPDESLVRQGIAVAERAAEHADASSLGEVISEDFDGNDGGADRRQLLGLLRAAAFRGDAIHALTGPLEVEQRGDRYVARFTVTLTSGGKLLPEQMGVYRVETAWRKEGRAWRCYSATWTSAG
ncbi:nuclear transport factor 2 family protein [Dyella solisilvae]|uniref:nuclear transport factor 2 family protein n=1 Tax=Dyella solisilvae TaxID=1920168 RepID=UPI001F336A3A|nr:nuclear transport factor 2 family protein [Dyella solisilvae]